MSDVSLFSLPTSSQPSAPIENSSGWDGSLKLKYLFMRRSENISPPLWKIFSPNVCAPPSLHYSGLPISGQRAACASRVLNVLAGKQGWRWRHAARCSTMERFVTKRSSSITMATCYSEDTRTALKHSRVWGRLLSVSLWRTELILTTCLCVATFSNSLQPPVVCCCSSSFLHPLSDAV